MPSKSLLKIILPNNFELGATTTVGVNDEILEANIDQSTDTITVLLVQDNQ
jgi:hypothetical protein